MEQVIASTISSMNRNAIQTYLAIDISDYTDDEIAAAKSYFLKRLEQLNSNPTRENIQHFKTESGHESLPGAEEHRGKALKRYTTSEGKSAIKKTDIEHASVIAYGGWDFTDARHHSALQKSIERLFELDNPAKQVFLNPTGKLKTPELLESIGVEVAVLAPNATKSERMAEVLLYNLDKTHISPEMQVHADQLWEAKFLKKDGSIRKPEEVPRFAQFCFSMGNRNALMVENALYKKLQAAGKNDDDIAEYFSRITRIGFAYAFDYRDMPERPRIPSVTVFSRMDQGVMIPPDLLKDVIFKDAAANAGSDDGYTLYDLNSVMVGSDNMQLFVLLHDGTQQPTFKGVPNYAYHGLFPYIDGFLNVTNQTNSDGRLPELYGKMLFDMLPGRIQTEIIHEMTEEQASYKDIFRYLPKHQAITTHTPPNLVKR